MLSLAEGIRRAVRFCPRGKAASPLMQAVRLVPASAGAPARVYALSGTVGVQVDVDGNVPDVVLPAAVVRSALRGHSEVDGLHEAGVGTVVLAVRSRAGVVDYKVPGGTVSTFPLFPPVPDKDQFQFLQGFKVVIGSVLPAAGKDAKRPELHVVHFEHGYAEATDLTRVCRLLTPWTLTGYVPAEVFAAWPKDGGDLVAGMVAAPYLFLKVGDEVRCAALREPGRYHTKMAAYLTEHLTSSVVLRPGDLADAARRSKDLSSWGIIVLELTPDRCVARSYQPERQRAGEASCEVVVTSPSPHLGSGARVEVTVSARYLVEAMEAALTPTVVLRYRDAVTPLRVESGALITCLWPSPWEDPPAANKE